MHTFVVSKIPLLPSCFSHKKNIWNS